MTWNEIRQRVEAMTIDELNEYAARKLGWVEVPRSTLEKGDLLLEILPDQETFWRSADGTTTRSNPPKFVFDITDAWHLVSYFERMGGDFSIQFLGAGEGQRLPLSWYAEFTLHSRDASAYAEEATAPLSITRAFVYLMECLE